MISIKDLMRGNLIATPTGIKTVAGFVPGKEVAAIYFEDGSHVGNHMCAPVPLSIEWLERCGFGFRTDDKVWYRQVGNTSYLEFDDQLLCGVTPETWRDQCPIYIWADVENVHQLQNLFAALTGTELEIKLP